MDELNGYKILANSYRAVMERNEPGTETMQKDIKVLDFLATCDDTEIYKLFDSSAFNDIVKAYCRKAMSNKGYDEEEIQTVIRELTCLFSEKTAKDIMA